MKLTSYVPKGRKTDNNTLLTILLLEAGALAHGLHYESIREGREANAYRAEAKVGLADLITVCRQIAEVNCWSWKDVVSTGEERFKERMDDARKKMADKKSRTD